MFSTSSKCSSPSAKFLRGHCSPPITRFVMSRQSIQLNWLLSPSSKKIQLLDTQLLLIGGRHPAVENTPKMLQGSKNMHITIFLVYSAGLCAEPLLPTRSLLHPLTHAHSVHPGPCNGNPRPISSTSFSSSSSSRYTCVQIYITIYFICDSCICVMVLPLPPLLVIVTNHSKLGDSGLCFSFSFVCMLMQDFHTCTVSLLCVY